MGRTMLTLGSVGATVLAMALMSSMKPHDEAALLSDWSAPPPWPVFIALNVLAGTLRAAADALTPPPIRVLDMAMGYHTTILAHTAQKFEIPDILAAAGEPMSGAEVAAKLNSDGALIERLLFACAAHGMFKLAAPAADGTPRFVNTAVSAVLRKGHPNSMRGMVGHNAEDLFGAWSKLPDYLADPTGPTAWDLANLQYPTSEGGFWAKTDKDAHMLEQFGQAMTSLDSLGAKAMVADGPWAGFKRFVDVGGNRGHFLHRLLEEYPSTTGVVFDRPSVIETTTKAWAAGGQFASATGRAEFKAGSFFDLATMPTAKDGDAFYMRYILHDWPAAEVTAILKNVRAAMGTAKDTALVIGECALPNHDVVGVPPVMYNIDIQMMAVFGGAQERTPDQWKEVFAGTGFELKTIHPTRSLLHWVVATPI